MAELNPLSGSGGSEDRGQLILVTGFALAFLLVAIVLLLNTSIYTENLASRGIDRSPDEAVEYRVAVREGVGDLIEAVNEDSDSHPDSEAALNASLANLSQMLRSQYSYRGTLALLQNESISFTDGFRIWQDTRAQFNNSTASGPTYGNWTLATDVSEARAVELNLTKSELAGSKSSSFQVRLFGDNGANWSVHIWEAGSPSEVVVEAEVNGIVVETCRSDRENVSIDLTSGWVGDSYCPGLNWAQGVTSPYDLAFWNTDRVEGTYTMVLKGGGFKPKDFDEPYPRKARVIYSAKVPLTYQTATLTYETNITVAPGEPGS